MSLLLLWILSRMKTEVGSPKVKHGLVRVFSDLCNSTQSLHISCRTCRELKLEVQELRKTVEKQAQYIQVLKKSLNSYVVNKNVSQKILFFFQNK